MSENGNQTKLDQRAIVELMLRLRQDHFKRENKVQDGKSAVIYYEETSFQGQPFDVPLVILRTAPCRWFSAGGCTMCNYELMAIDDGVSEQEILTQVDRAIEKLGDLRKYHYLFLTSQGSFFDDHEVRADTRLEIASRLKSNGITRMSTESEAKFCVNNERIPEFAKALDAPLSIGIGLESSNDYVRNVVVNKGMPIQTFQHAAEFLSQNSIGFYTYVLLGKPFLSPAEDIEDAIRTIVDSLEMGAFMCVVELVNIQPFTLTAKLNEIGIYSPPSMWAGIELLRRLPKDLRNRVSIKGFTADVEPEPILLPTTCPVCRSEVVKALDSWNYSRDYDVVRQLIGGCNCYHEWAAELAQPVGTTLQQRVREGVDSVWNSIR